MLVFKFFKTSLIAATLCVGTGSMLTAASPVVGSLERKLNIDDVTKGTLLLGELNCAACHDLGESANWVTSKPAPNLENIGSRVNLDWLKSYLANPHDAKPGTTMPHVLAGEDTESRNETAEAIAHYLMSIESSDQSGLPIKQGSVEQGEALYYSIGCVACHSHEENIPDSIPLGNIESKYSLSGLVTFLKDPLKVRPGGRMPDLALDHNEAVDVATYLLRSNDGSNSRNTEADPSLVSKGKKHFTEQRCVACHQLDRTDSDQARKPVAISNMTGGCLSGTIGAWPDYSLSRDQVTSIKSALSSSKKTLSNEEQIRLTMVQMNCVACHERDGFGGVSEQRDQWFGSHDLNVGEQGRIPPTLSNVGAKLNQATLRKVLVEGAPVRPYLKTRMPQFGAGNVERLIELFAETDELEPIDEVVVGPLHEFRNDGRKLVGNEAFTCIACHSFKGKKTGSMAVIDLTEMGQRLKRDWFISYMFDPQKFSPSTLMPGFWPGGKSGYEELYEGDGMKQVHAIWFYLEEGYGAGQPRGMQREPMRILATDETKMLRRSYRGVGKRGIGVGYPGNVNLVFSAEQMSLAAIWKGEFLDPAGVWLSQGHGTARPMARPIELTNQPELARLPSIESGWPVVTNRPPAMQFKGYELDAQRRPQFQYQLGSIEVEDYFSELSASGDASGLRRVLEFTAADAAGDGLVFRAAIHEKIQRTGSGDFQIGDGLRVRFPNNAEPVLVDLDGKQELRVPIQFRNRRSQLTVEYLW